MPASHLAIVSSNPLPIPVPSTYPSSVITLSPLPYALYQFPPHTTFEQMRGDLDAIAKMGFAAIQMPPIHPVGRQTFGSKRGSAYAPMDCTRVSPFIYRGVSAGDYLDGHYTEEDDSARGWIALAELAGFAAHKGLKVSADLVFGHTARDAGVVKRFEDEFGRAVYKRDPNSKEIITGGAPKEEGGWDAWLDVAPLDHNGPAREKLLAHFGCVLERFLSSGVEVFRADAAPTIPADFWRPLIKGARTFAAGRGLPRPVFYAEALGTDAGHDKDLVEAGFDGVTNSLRWWDMKDPDFVRRYENVRSAGGGSVSFADTHDTGRVAAKYADILDLATRLTLTAFMTDSMTVLAGTEDAEEVRPSVFLADIVEEDIRMIGIKAGHVKRLIKMLMDIKRDYPILNSRTVLEMIEHGGDIAILRRVTSGEEVLMVANRGGQNLTLTVPERFRQGALFGTGWMGNGDLWFGRPGNNVPIHSYVLAAGGMVAFYGSRAVAPPEFPMAKPAPANG